MTDAPTDTKRLTVAELDERREVAEEFGPQEYLELDAAYRALVEKARAVVNPKVQLGKGGADVALLRALRAALPTEEKP